MHLRTHTKPESLGQAGRWQSPYHDTMIDHDKDVGALLDELDELGIAEDTIVIYSTDNGPHMNTWPDGGMTPFRSEKNTNWEGAFRIPEVIRWPGTDPRRLGLQRDHPAPRLAADFRRRRGRPGYRREAQGGSYRSATRPVQGAHRRLQPAAVPDRQGRKSPRQGLIYFSDDCDVLGLRFDNWKVVFMEQRGQGTLQIWAEPFVPLRVPKLFNLRTDPFERADITSNTYYDWFLDHDFIVIYAGRHRRPSSSRRSRSSHLARSRPLHHRPGGRQAADLPLAGRD